MGIIKRFIDRFRKPSHDPLDIVQEVWEADFGKEKKRRFPVVHEQRHSATFEQKGMSLRLSKKSYFAWVDDPLYRYRDFVIDSEIEFGLDNGHSAAGFVFRQAGPDTFYYFLVSNRGFFRFDLVFNGNPIKLIGWTESVEKIDGSFGLRIIANGSTFVFCINDTSVAEIEDESIDAGGIAFAGQNYQEKEHAAFYLTDLYLDSRPYNVEAQYVRWREVLPIPAAQRVHLAESLYALGYYYPAAVQIKKAAASENLSVQDSLFYGELLVRLQLYDQALEHLEYVLREEPDNIRGAVLKADALYSLNMLFEGKEFIESVIDRFGDSPVLWNLWGNMEYGLGNPAGAKEKYDKAFSLDPEGALFAVNAAKTALRLDKPEEGTALLTKAAVLLFQQEAFDDLSYVLQDIDELDPGNNVADAIRGKIFFQEGEFDRGKEIFTKLTESGCEDAAVWYLNGIIRLREGAREKALPMFEKAVELENDYYLYWFRLAETRYGLGLDPTEQIEKAVTLNEQDPWVLNFAGLFAMDKGNIEEAVRLFDMSYNLAHDEPEICVNLSEGLAEADKSGKALEVLHNFENESWRIYNQLGNLHARAGDLEKSAEMYEKCLEMEPENIICIENCASVYVELDKIPEAEELIRKGLTLEPKARLYNLMGNIAVMFGEYPRAEESFKAGLQLDPGDTVIRCNYAELLIFLRRFEDAIRILDEVTGVPGDDRIRELKIKIRSEIETEISCSGCGRIWIAPKNVPPQGPLRLHGELPDESPAGMCPGCGAVYCVGCGKHRLDEGRFLCLECGERLKLGNDYLKYLVRQYI